MFNNYYKKYDAERYPCRTHFRFDMFNLCVLIGGCKLRFYLTNRYQ